MYTYPRINDFASLAWREGDDRIEVKFADLGDFFNETRDPQQRFFKGFQNDQRLPSIASDASDHLMDMPDTSLLAGGADDGDSSRMEKRFQRFHVVVL